MDHWLAPEQAQAYSHLTTESLAIALRNISRPDVNTDNQSEGLYAAGLEFAGLPAALALVMVMPSSTLEVLSIAAAKPLRRLGLATELLNWLQKQVTILGLDCISLSYPLNHPCTVAMGKMTGSNRGWNCRAGLRLIHLDLQGGTALAKKVELSSSYWKRTNRFQLTQWKHLSRNQLAELEALEHAPQWVRPWLGKTDSVMGLRANEVSQVLIDQGRIAGWLITQHVGASMFRVTQWWVQQELQGRGVAILLLQQALLNALHTRPLDFSCTFAIHTDVSPAMLHLSKKHIEPLALKVVDNRRATWREPKALKQLEPHSRSQ